MMNETIAPPSNSKNTYTLFPKCNPGYRERLWVVLRAQRSWLDGLIDE